MITISSAGADQMVVRRSITPTVSCRKWPGVAIRSGALAERPNCQTDWAAAIVASRNGKSTGMPFFSAAALKWIAMSGASATPRPQYKYESAASSTTPSAITWVRVRGQPASATTRRRKSGVPLTTVLSTRISVICIVNGSSIQRPR